MSEKILNKIISLRTEKKLTQEQLATAVGVTRQTIIAVEKGKYIPSLNLAFKLSLFFNTSIEEIFTYEKN